MGARVHNLKDVSVKIPKGRIVAITGVSGSGKSSFAFDVLYAEGRKRYLDAIGMPDYAEQDRDFDRIGGLSPAVAVEQRTAAYTSPRSTIGTRTGIYYLLRQLYILESPGGCGLKLKDLSFNEPAGWCPKCRGTGYVHELRESKLVPDPSKNLYQICEEGAFGGIKNLTIGLAAAYGFDIGTAYRDLPREARDAFLHGTDRKVRVDWRSDRFQGVIESEFEGIIPHLYRVLAKTSSAYRVGKIEREFMSRSACDACGGCRLGERARSALLAGRHIGELSSMTMGMLSDFLDGPARAAMRTAEGRDLCATIVEKLGPSALAGIPYLSLDRSMSTLSGGEIQRLSLMAHLNADLDSLLFILDEPSHGMHELEKGNLVAVLEKLKGRGNTVIIVEHDRRLIQAADHVIDFGPGAGTLGGSVVFQGSVDDMKKAPGSLTGRYLSGELAAASKGPAKRRKRTSATKYIRLSGASTNNLKDVAISFPLGMMVGVAGVSGCGKSSLVIDTLVPLLRGRLSGEDEASVEEDVSGRVAGSGHVAGCVVVAQSPIGRVRTSNPASYTGIWNDIRGLFARQGLALERGFDPGYFSFNGEKGACPKCGGSGEIEVALSSFTSVGVRCDACDGAGYRPEVLEVEYRGKSIRDVLDMTVSGALELFRGEPGICRYLKILEEMGMGYITLGQPAPTLSGGEAQRIKLARELGKQKKGGTLYVLDEPTSGLHDHDVNQLLAILDRLADRGNTVLVIEHNTAVLSYMDHLIELGPGGGPDGGTVIAEGSPEELAADPRSIIGPFLRPYVARPGDR